MLGDVRVWPSTIAVLGPLGGTIVPFCLHKSPSAVVTGQ